MKNVTISVAPVRQGEEANVAIIHEKKRERGDWVREKVWDLSASSTDQRRNVLLADDERIIIEGRTDRVTVYDPEQNAAKVVDADPEVRAKQDAAEKAIKDANDARQRKAAELPKTNLGSPPPMHQPPQPQQNPQTPATTQAPTGGQAAQKPTPNSASNAGAAHDTGQGQRGTKG